jgi:hypothetical protein
MFKKIEDTKLCHYQLRTPEEARKLFNEDEDSGGLNYIYGRFKNEINKLKRDILYDYYEMTLKENFSGDSRRGRRVYLGELIFSEKSFWIYFERKAKQLEINFDD